MVWLDGISLVPEEKYYQLRLQKAVPNLLITGLSQSTL